MFIQILHFFIVFAMVEGGQNQALVAQPAAPQPPQNSTFL